MIHQSPDALHARGYAPPSWQTLWRTLAALAIIMMAAALLLYAMGRQPLCKCGSVKFWHGVVQSPENSQHITDWYTWTHVTHGFIFYALFAGTRKMFRWPVTMAAALIFATGIEAVWEVAENSNAVIERYRAATISLDYFGDSIINSMADILAMIMGFLLAMALPVRISLALNVASELALAFVIRDNLALNIIMLIYPLDAIKAWQGGG